VRYTLLEITQQILSAMDSDEVASINDTVESYQVALLVKSVFYDIATDLNLPEHNGLFELDASGDNNKPTLMTIPTTVTRLDSIKYDQKLTADTYKNYRDVEYMPWPEFMRMQSALIEDETNVGQMNVTHNSETFEVMYRDDRAPTYWSTFDDYQIIFDSYNSDEDTTLQKSKTMCQGALYPTFSMTDGAYPDIDPTQFSYFVNKCKTRAFAELKQSMNAESNAETRRQKIILQKRMRRTQGKTYGEIDKVPHFGRK
jgi:hypothetical protein